MQEKMARKKIHSEGKFNNVVTFIKIWQFLFNIILIQNILEALP